MVIALLAGLAVPVVGGEGYFTHLAIIMLISWILAASLNLLIGYTGLVSIAHAAFFGIGGYTSGILVVKLRVPFWIALVLAMLVTAVVALGIGIPSFRNGNLVALLVSLGEFGIILSIPLWLQNALGYGALGTGLVLLALAGGSFFASGLAGGLSGRVSAVTIVRMGVLLEIAGLVVIALVISVDTPWWAICLGLFVYGVGVGLATAQLTGVLVAEVARSGISAFGGAVSIGYSAVSCTKFDLVGEDVGTATFSFEKLGDNLCGCPDPADLCKVDSPGLAPPELH